MVGKAKSAFEAELGNGKTDVPVMETIAAIISHVVAPVIFNKELAKNGDALKATAAYLSGVFLTGFIMLKIPFPELLGWPLYTLQRRRMQKVIDIVAPVVQREINERARGLRPDPDVNAISCSVAQLSEAHLTASETVSQVAKDIASEVNHDFQAATPNPASVIAQMIFQVLAEPKYLKPLKEEAEEAITKYGWTADLFKGLILQDSFIRELSRVKPIAHLQAQRKVMNEPLVLHDGVILPVGTKIAIATACQTDPNVVGLGTDFDGFRFAKLAAESNDTEDGKWSSTYPSKDNLLFGYGNHACPGRLMGIRIVKLIFTKLILGYDISWDLPEGMQPKRFEIEGFSLPNPMQKLTFRRRIA